MTEGISKDSKDSNKSSFFTVTAVEYRILEKIWEKNHQKLETPSPKAKSKNHTFVQFRIKPEEVGLLSNIAKTAHNQGAIKAPTISALAKSCFYTQTNQWLLIQQKNAMIIEHNKRMKELQASVSSGPSFSYVQLETPSPKAKSKNHTFVQFRIKPEEVELLSNIAKTVHNQGAIKAPTISALAKSCFYTQTNQWLLIQQKSAMIIEHDKRMKELQTPVSSGPSFSYVPPSKPL